MAAAEYYSGGQSPPSRPALSTTSTPPYPLSDAPPPYSALVESNARPQSQPPPARLSSEIYRPYPPNHSAYPPEKQSRPPPPSQEYGGSYIQQQQQPPQNQDYGGSYNQRPPQKQEYGGSYNQPPQKQSYGGPYNQQQNGYLQRPGPSSFYKQSPTSDPGYDLHTPQAHFRPERSRDRSRSRSRDRERERERDRSRDRHRRHQHRPDSHHRPDSRHRHDKDRHEKDKKKPNSTASTFLGAGGGALIGDAIFPGLGTLGGALLGGLGGHKVGKDNTKEKDKEREQRYGHGSSHRPKGRSYSNDADYHYADERRRGKNY